jgi:hypothetical protein
MRIRPRATPISGLRTTRDDTSVAEPIVVTAPTEWGRAADGPVAGFASGTTVMVAGARLRDMPGTAAVEVRTPSTAGGVTFFFTKGGA